MKPALVHRTADPEPIQRDTTDLTFSEYAEPVDEKLPLRTRFLVITGFALASWVLVGAIGYGLRTGRAPSPRRTRPIDMIKLSSSRAQAGSQGNQSAG